MNRPRASTVEKLWIGSPPRRRAAEDSTLTDAPEGSAMFQGRWPNTLSIDGKNRLALPARFRVGLMDQDGNAEFMVGVLNSPCLYVHTADQHKRFLDRIYRRLGDTTAKKQWKTYIVSRFVPVTADSQGRLTIPASLLEKAVITKDVVLIAQEARLEAWSTAAFEQLEREVEAGDLGQVLDDVFAEEERDNGYLHRAPASVGEGNPSG